MDSGPPPRKRILLGAPRLPAFEDPVLKTPRACPPPSTSISAGPTWRILHRRRQRLRTGMTQASYPPTAPTATATADDDDDHDDGHALDDTLDYSLAMYEDSQVASDADESTFTSFGSNATQMSQLPSLPPLVSLTELEDLPEPSLVAESPPHTHTLTLLVGVISVAPPRFVTTRYGTQMEVTVLAVGDETAAGFRVDLWTQAEPVTPAAREMKHAVEGLQVRDVVALKGFSLAVWRDVLYAQTRRGVSSVGVVWSGSRRWKGRGLGEGLAEKKLGRVVGWVRDFVGDGEAMEEDEMPADTPV